MENKCEDLIAAKEWYKIAKEQDNKLAIEILVSKFPELKESDDEEIKKELLLDIPKVFPHDKAFKYIAWLEKQNNLMKCLQIANARIGELIEENYYLKEKQDEQKPVWREEDEMMLESTIKHLKESTYSAFRPYLKKDVDWLKSLKDRVQPQQEWADEHLSVVRTKELIRAEIQKQKQNLIDSIGRISNKELNLAHHILCVLESFINTIPEKSIEWTEDDENKVTLFMQLVEGCDNYEELSNWLKSLKDRVQPQNLIVTDEELAQAKKDAYNDALNKIEYHSGEPTFDDGWSAAIWYLKKRNVQPQTIWKPSDKQMEALKEACDEHWEPDGLDPLYVLWEQLKKLMEK